MMWVLPSHKKGRGRHMCHFLEPSAQHGTQSNMSFSTEIWHSSCFYGELCEESVSELPKLPLTADFCLLYLADFVILKSFSKEGKRFGKGRV